MRYSILGFNQELACKFELDIRDLLILDYVYQAVASPKMEHIIKDNKTYVWIYHEKLLQDLPMLGIEEEALKKRLKKLVNLDMLYTEKVSNNTRRGSKAFYGITEKCDELRTTDQVYLDTLENERPGVSKYTSNNKLKNINILSKDNILQTRQLVCTEKQKKPNQFQKCMQMINDFTDDTNLQFQLHECFKLFNENARESNTPFYSNTFKGKLNKLKSLSDDVQEQIQICLQTLDNGWNSFYALKKDKYNSKVSSDMGFETKRGDKEALKEAIANGKAEKF